MSSLLFYNVENSKNKEKPLCVNFWLVLYTSYDVGHVVLNRNMHTMPNKHWGSWDIMWSDHNGLVIRSMQWRSVCDLTVLCLSLGHSLFIHSSTQLLKRKALRPKWHLIPYIVYYFWPGALWAIIGSHLGRSWISGCFWPHCIMSFKQINEWFPFLDSWASQSHSTIPREGDKSAYSIGSHNTGLFGRVLNNQGPHNTILLRYLGADIYIYI